jgi:hypothetical protein
MASRKRSKARRNHSSSKRKRSRRSGFKVVVLLFATVCSGYAAYRLDVNGYFTIKQVNVNRTEFIPETSLDSLCRNLFLGQSMLSDLNDEKSELSRLTFVKKVRCLRRFPDRIRIQVEERRPVALANVGELLPVDSEGFVLPLDIDRHALELPIITPRSVVALYHEEGSGMIRLDKEGCQLIQAVMAFNVLAPEMLPMVSEFTINDQGKITIVTMEQGLRVVMGRWVKRKNLDYLKWMLEELAARHDIPELVDLSFEGQIIVKSRKDG